MWPFSRKQKNQEEKRPNAMYQVVPTGIGLGFGGQKYAGGISLNLYDTVVDYWTARENSAAFFERNLYARGIIRRLCTNVIATGLWPEVLPDERVIGVPEDSLSGWSEHVETLFALWGDRPSVCDAKGQRDWAGLLETIYRESLIGGDSLVIIRQARDTGMPQLQVVSGSRVRTPLEKLTDRNVVDGVELDEKGRHVAYYVITDDGKTTRVPAYGQRTGRRIAMLVYGCDKREDTVRGTPLLTVVLQALEDVDKYRVAAQRKADVNARVVGFIKRSMDRPGTNPFAQGSKKRSSVSTDDDTGRKLRMDEIMPGLFMERLQPGEEPVAYTGGADVSFGDFEAAVLNAIAWALEIPPEILLMSFNKNYSASQAALNEFRMNLSRLRHAFAVQVCYPVYEEWFISSVLRGDFEAGEFLRRRTRAVDYAYTQAWLRCDWGGAVKPFNDPVKIVTAYQEMVDRGWLTNERASRELTGTKFARNVRRLRTEEEQKAKLQSGQEDSGGAGVVAIRR